MEEQLHVTEWKTDIDIDMDLRCFNLSKSIENDVRNRLRIIDKCFRNSFESRSKIGQILELRGLMFSFIASYRNPEIYGVLSHAPSGAAYEETHSALRRFRANLKRRQSLTRPKSSLDQLLIQLTSFYEKATGQNAAVRFRGDDAPDSNFEKMVFAAFEISSLIQQPELSQPERTYSGALKAYRRATKPTP